MMLTPIATMDMYLYIPGPFHPADIHSGVEEIRPCIMVRCARFQYDNRLTIRGGQLRVEHLVLPNKMQECLSHQLNISFILSKKPRSCFVGFGLKLSCF